MTTSEIELSPTLQRWMGRAASLMIALVAMACGGILVQAISQLTATAAPGDVVAFCVVPGLLLAGLLATLRSSVARRVNLALLLVAGGASLLFAESALLITRGYASPPALEAPDGKPVPTSYQVLLDLRKRGVRAFSRVTEGMVVGSNVTFNDGPSSFHPVSPAPGGSTVVLCSESTEPVIYEADRYGFNNPDELWDGDVDVAVVGDSYVHGMCVQRQHQIPALLSQRWRTLNIGATNSGPFRELAMLREYASTKTPPIVVWVYYEGNDLVDMTDEVGHRWLADYLDPAHRQGLAEHAEAIDPQYALWLDSLIDRPRPPQPTRAAGPLPTNLIRDVPRLSTLRGLVRFGATFPDKDPLGALPRVLERANADVASWGGRLVVVYVPARLRYDVWGGEGQRGHRELLAFLEQKGIPHVDLDPIFRATGDPKALWTHARGHLSEEGYWMAAEAIAAAIDELGNAPSHLGLDRAATQ